MINIFLGQTYRKQYCDWEPLFNMLPIWLFLLYRGIMYFHKLRLNWHFTEIY